MDKRVVFSVAGSGKTKLIVDSLEIDSRALIITYTNNNTRNLKNRILAKFGVFPEHILLLPYFTFLYTFCFRPFLGYSTKARGLFWENPPDWTGRIPLTNTRRFFTPEKKIFHNRLAKFLEVKETIPDIIARIERYFDMVLIDEIQDFGGHDFNFLKYICQCKARILMVGDFFQHTFDTSRDGRTNSTIYNDYDKYQSHFKNMGVHVDIKSLNKSWRCTPTICKFIDDNLGITIESHKKETSEVTLIDNEALAKDFFNDPDIVKLFYSNYHKYPCYARNMGKTKGDDMYKDVCLVLNRTSYKLFTKGQLIESAPTTKNKLYVGFSRAKRHLYLMPEVLIEKYKKE